MYRCIGWFVVCVSVRICWYPVLSADNFYVTRVGWINCFIVIYCGFSFICILFLGTLARDLIYSLCSFYANIFCGYRTESNLVWTHLYILYMRGLYYCYCMHICIAVLSTFHSAPAFPRTKSEAVSGDYKGCKASVVELCVRNLPSGGFAILSAFYFLKYISYMNYFFKESYYVCKNSCKKSCKVVKKLFEIK